MTRRTSIVFLLVGAGSLLVAAVPPDKSAADEPRMGFAVHEWGVFRVHDDVASANADMAAVWDDLPAFVYGQAGGRQPPRFPLRDEAIGSFGRTPVVFFYSEQPLHVKMRVDFPGGKPIAWWPATSKPVLGTRQIGWPTATRLEWELDLLQPGRCSGLATAPKKVAKNHWFLTLREVGATTAFAWFGGDR